MKKFPKTVFVVVQDYDDEDSEEFELVDCEVSDTQADAIEFKTEGTPVAIYELKKQGTVKTSRRIAFE